jgi:hypothetical protein
MKNRFLSLIFVFSFVFSISGESTLALRLTDLSGGLTEEEIKGLIEPEEEEEEEESKLIPDTGADPVIESIVIQGSREVSGAKVNLTGKNLLPTKGSVSVSFSGGSVSSFSYKSPTLLIFELPGNVQSGNVYVTTTSEHGKNRKSKGHPFEFHPPKILFVTGEDGIAPGKKIQVWGEYLDGIFYRKNGRSEVAEVKNGYLQGAGVAADGNLSVIELELPKDNFNKEFWVRRNCDPQGKNCLESNKISFENAVPPVLTDLQIDYQNRKATLFGKNFPENSSDLSVTFDGKGVSKEYYSYKEGKISISLPCPLPSWSIAQVSYKGIKSNPLLFTIADAPAIFNGVLVASPTKTGKSRFEVSVADRIDIPSSSACDKDKLLFVNSRQYSVRKYGGKYITDDIDTSSIPSSGDMYVVFEGVKSDTIPFSKKTFSLSPHIFRVESKYGFRPGTTFSIFGRNLGNEYKSCDIGETIIDGVDVIYEERDKIRVGTNEDGKPIYETVCRRNPPKVTPGIIIAQFKPLEYGSRSNLSEKTVSVTVDGKKSNSITIPFGDAENNTVNIAQSAPDIRTIEYPEGHTLGSEIIIRGNEFGVEPKHNIVSFGGTELYPSSANSRGTELRVRIPKDAKSGNLTVLRKTPNPQSSQDSYEVVITPHEEKAVRFFYENEEDIEDVEVADSSVSFSFPALSYINSSGNLQVNRFVMELEWEDGDPEDDYSVQKSKIAPFDTFTLQVGGKTVSLPTIANVSRKKILVQFLPFEIPLTSSEQDSLVLKTALLPTVTDGSRFRLKFSPKNSSQFLALNTETGKGVSMRSEEETLVLPWVTIQKTEDDTCIDVDSSGANCDAYREQKQQNILFSQQKESHSDDLEESKQPLTRQEKVDQILARLEREKERRVQEILQKKQSEETKKVDAIVEKKEDSRREKAKYFLLKFGREKAEHILRILEKQDRIDAKIIGRSSEELQRESQMLVQMQQKQTERKKILDQNTSIAKRIFSYRKDDDRDGLSNAEELIMGTDPNDKDTDRDGYSDFLEVEFGNSPIDRSGKKIFSDISAAGKDAGYISRLFFLGAFPDFQENTFRPQEAVTRSFFTAVLANIFVRTEWEPLRDSLFEDVSREDWFAPHVLGAQNMGANLQILSGSFRPYDKLTRQEACQMIFPLLRHKEYAKAEGFSDVFHEDKDSVGICVSFDLLSAIEPAQTDEDGEEISAVFGSDEYLTRAEAARILYRTIFLRFADS